VLEAGRAPPPAGVCSDSYELVYTPTIEAIHAEGLDGYCPGATDADRILWAYQRRRELVPERGCRGLDEAAREVVSAKPARPSVRRLLPGLNG
jgi:hypothetical protein